MTSVIGGLREFDMPKWQYKVIEVYSGERVPAARWIWAEDGERLPGSPQNPRITTLVERFDALGADGWELVSVSLVSTPATEYWFKRRISRPPPPPN
jgi:hypothetical protein